MWKRCRKSPMPHAWIGRLTCLVFCLGLVPTAAAEREGAQAASTEGPSRVAGLNLFVEAMVAGDPAERRELLHQASELGSPFAQAELGNMYSSGRGVEQDDAEAVRWYRRAAAQGSGAAQVSLGHMYIDGRGVERNPAEALRWYRLAAEQDIVNAQYALGFSYATGRGVAQDPAEAARWYRLAADQGNAEAQYNLGGMYAQGVGVPVDEAEAVRLFRSAAVQGLSEAQYDLGVMYAAGRGVRQSDERAYVWLDLAAGAASGEKGVRAARARADVVSRLTAEQKSAAQAAASACFSSADLQNCGE